MSIGANFGSSYPPSQAEDGKFVALDIDDLVTLGYPLTGRGRYAVLTHEIDGSTQITDASGNAATVTNGYLNVRIADSIAVLSAFEIDATGVSGLQIRAELEYPDTSIYASNGAILANGVSSYDFGMKVQSIEVFNIDSNNTVYIGYNTNNLNTLSTVGLPLIAESYYSMDREGQYVYVGNPNGTPTDVRVIGHYRNA